MNKNYLLRETILTIIALILCLILIIKTNGQSPQFAALTFYPPQKEDGTLNKYTCSGVLVHNGKMHDYLVTAGHAIESDYKIVVRFLESNKFFFGEKGLVIPEMDTAIIVIPKTGITARRIAKTEPKVGDQIWIEGVPSGKFLTKVCKITSVTGKLKGIGDIEFLPHCIPGDSGGPLINKDGLVIGIATINYRNEQNIRVGAGPNLVIIQKMIKNIDSIGKQIESIKAIKITKKNILILTNLAHNLYTATERPVKQLQFFLIKRFNFLFERNK
jgi:S1-C subfamily serine protease